MLDMKNTVANLFDLEDLGIQVYYDFGVMASAILKMTKLSIWPSWN